MKGEERICAQCSSEEVEDVVHAILRCSSVDREGEVLEKRMVDYYPDRWDKKKGVVILDEACNDERTRISLERMWAIRFM